MINQLNQRERIFVFAGGFALALILLYFAIVAPYRSSLNRLDRQITVRSGQLQEVKALQTRYLELKQQMTQMERLLGKRQDFSAFTFVENLVERTAGRENLLSMRPQSPEVRNEFTVDAVEIKLEKLTLKQLLELLLGIEEAATPMQVKNLYLKQRFDDRSLLDATMTVTALRRTT
jgi:general secretion pathway protein M